MGRVVHVEDLAIELGCKVREIPATYLGQPLGSPFQISNSMGCNVREVS